MILGQSENHGGYDGLEWSTLGKPTREALLAKGVPFWHQLLKILMPHVVVLSIAEEHWLRIKFEPLEDRQTLHAFEFTKNGARRERPCRVASQWRKIMGEPSLFVFGCAAQKPFGLIHDEYKEQVGELARGKFYEGP